MSMVLRDQNFARMSHQEWSEAVRPKVQGTWNLHNACVNSDLDFFILFSSISGVYGQRGQANYAGANTFLDAFVQYRHSLGLPAGAVDIGMMFDHGAVAENPQLLARLTASGGYGVRVNQLLDCLEVILQAPRIGEAEALVSPSAAFVEQSQLVLGLRSLTSLSDPNNRQPWKADRRMAIYHNDARSRASSGSKSSSTTKLTSLMNEATSDPKVLSSKATIDRLAEIIARQLFQLLLRPVEEDGGVDVSQSLGEAGLDSLVAIEMRAWWKSSFSTDISVLEMLGMPTLLALGEHAAKSLQKKLEDEGTE
jgi:aryl carrier-like protein